MLRAMRMTLSHIYTYPLKSGAPLVHEAAQVEPRGLHGDRRFMVITASAKFLTGRQQPRLTLIRVRPADTHTAFEAPGMPTLSIDHPPSHGERIATEVWGAAVRPLLATAAAHAWFSEFLGSDCRLVYMDLACTRALKAKYGGKYGLDSDEVSLADGFPLLLASQAALDLLNSKLAQPVPMLRFRPNLVVAGSAPHAEDGWRRIRVGETEFEVAKPCTRCVFTTVDFERGALDPTGEPLRTLIGYRRTPDGVTFGQNLIPRRLGSVRVGDPVEVLA
jgi:uncharacterized protein YcbX